MMRQKLLVKTSTLKKIFDIYIEDSISDEQVNRVLNPVLSLIKEGKFDRPRRFSLRGARKSRGPLNFLKKTNTIGYNTEL